MMGAFGFMWNHNDVRAYASGDHTWSPLQHTAAHGTCHGTRPYKLIWRVSMRFAHTKRWRAYA